MRTGCCWSASGAARVEHVLEPPRAVGQRPRARPACGARRRPAPRRRARRSPTRAASARRRRRWRRPGRRGRRPARPACGCWRGARRGPPASAATGGRRRPSCWISVASAGMEPGAAPPTSAWWARLAAQPTSRPSRWHGRHEGDVVEVGAAGEGVVDDDLVAGPDAVAERVDGGAHRRRHRAEVHRDVLGLDEQLADGGEQRRRAVGPLLDVGAEGGAPQHRAHLLGHAGEPGQQDRERGRAERVSVAARSWTRLST